jgi:50S ribosomal protein L16 3-hydroxylase
MLSMIDIDQPLPLLGGLTPTRFMRRHWHKTPLLVRQAVPGVLPPLTRTALFALAARDDVESRLVVREGRHWSLRQGPLPRRALPPPSQPRWTLLVQGLDLHVDAAQALLSRFRFVPAARLDDLLLSYASAGTSTPTTCSCCRSRAAGAGATALARGRCCAPTCR